MFVELIKPFLGKAAGERLHLSAEEGQQLIQAGVARAVLDDPITPIITKGIESALAGFTRGLDAVIQQTLKQFADAQGAARRHGVPAIFGPFAADLVELAAMRSGERVLDVACGPGVVARLALHLERHLLAGQLHRERPLDRRADPLHRRRRRQ